MKLIHAIDTMSHLEFKVVHKCVCIWWIAHRFKSIRRNGRYLNIVCIQAFLRGQIPWDEDVITGHHPTGHRLYSFANHFHRICMGTSSHRRQWMRIEEE